MTPEELYKYDSFLINKSFTFRSGRFTMSTCPETEYIITQILDYKVEGRKRHHEA